MTAEVIPFPGIERLRAWPQLPYERLRGRVGKFAIADAVIVSYPSEVMSIMGECIIVAAERCPAHDVTVYVAICAQFDEIEKTTPAPTYEWRYEGARWKPFRFDVPAPRGHAS